MAVICPTVTAFNPHEFREQIERITPITERLHLDFMDGKFVAALSPPLKNAWCPEGKIVDLHVMYMEPLKQLKAFLKLKPHMVIVHAEAEGDFSKLADSLHQAGIKFGLALLQQTAVEKINPLLDNVDHILIFGGTLGHFGGHADLGMLSKVKTIKNLKPQLEIGWDGGVTDLNIRELAKGGIDVLNVGGFIQHAVDPAAAYVTLKTLAEK